MRTNSRLATIGIGVLMIAGLLISPVSARSIDSSGDTAQTWCADKRDGFRVRMICVKTQTPGVSPATPVAVETTGPKDSIIFTGVNRAPDTPLSVVVIENYMFSINGQHLTLAIRRSA